MFSTREEISSVLSCYERFCQKANREIASHDRSIAKVAKAGRERVLKEREEREAKARAEQDAKDRAVEYTVSDLRWDGVEEVSYTNKMGFRRNVMMVLRDKPLKVEVKENKLFPQVVVKPSRGKDITITLHTCRGWEVARVDARGSEVEMEIRRCV